MARFRKKPVEIEAVCWNGCMLGLTNKPVDVSVAVEPDVRLEKPEWMPPVADVVETDPAPGEPPPIVPPGSIFRRGNYLFIGTLEGVHRADPGDWVIKGVKGEIYPCKPDIFAATYDAVD